MTIVLAENSISLRFLDVSQVDNPLSQIDEINTTLTGWDEDTGIIFRKYIRPYQNHQAKHIVFDFAIHQESVVGYTIARPDKTNENTAYLAFIAVDSNHQGKGIGSKLLINTIEKIRSLGFRTLVIDTESKNEKFYERFAVKHLIPFSSKDREVYTLSNKQITYQLDHSTLDEITDRVSDLKVTPVSNA